MTGLDSIPDPDHVVGTLRFAIPRRFLGHLASWLNFLLVPLIAWRGIRLVRKHSIIVVLTLPWNEYFVAAFFICMFTGAELSVWVMDDPLGGRGRFDFRAPLYSSLLGPILRKAKWVWGISTAMCDDLNRRYGCGCEPLMPFAEIEGLEAPKSKPRLSRDLNIVHAGAIYTLQVGAVRNLVQAIAESNVRSRAHTLRLTLVCPLSRESLTSMGLGPSYVSAKAHVPPHEVPSLLAEADILFLGYSFGSGVKHMASTSLPTKLTEYLPSGVPILVHAPPYASISRYCREQEFGLLVDEPDVGKLCEAIERLSTDTGLRNQLVRNARATAVRNHAADRARSRFFQSLREKLTSTINVEVA